MNERLISREEGGGGGGGGGGRVGIRDKGFRDLITGKDFLLCRTKNEYDVFLHISVT